MRSKHLSWWESKLAFLQRYWVIITFITTGISGFGYTIFKLPPRVEAVEKNVLAIESRQQTIERYVESIEEQKELQKKAPLGWRFDEVSGEYVLYKDDPRLKKK